jgi:DNA-binding transcriptional MerR regulator
VSNIRLYLDEDMIKKALIKALRKANFDVLTTSEANNLRSPDPEQLIYATQQERVIYSYNMGDFCRLHGIYMEQGLNHSGIIIAERQTYSVGEQLRGLLRVTEKYSAETIKNQLVFMGGYIP